MCTTCRHVDAPLLLLRWQAVGDNWFDRERQTLWVAVKGDHVIDIK